MDENDVLHGSIPPSFDEAEYIGGTRFRTAQRALSVWPECVGVQRGISEPVNTTPESQLRGLSATLPLLDYARFASRPFMISKH
jgi:hypothetical protein